MYEEFTKYPGGAIAHRYISEVLDGTIVACEFVKLACQRHLNDLEHGHERGLWFDPDAGQRVLDFKQMLKQSKGKWAGKRLHLEPWQVFINWVLFGWKNEDGTRRFIKMYEEVARKNGKSTEIAGTGLYGLMADGEGGAEIYSVATKEEQAKITLVEGQNMTLKSGCFGRRAKVLKKAIVVDATNSCWKALGKDSKYQDGLNIHMALIDEYHAHPDSSMLDVIDSGVGARENPLICIITTAGFNVHSACHMERDYAINVLRGVAEDDTYFAIVFTLDEGDKWTDEDVWIKSNPNLGVTVSINDMRRMCNKAKESPIALNPFLTKKLNVWTSQETKFLNMEKWENCKGTISLEELKGRPCYVSGDLASKIDIASLVAVFRLDDGRVAVLPKFYCPRETAIVRSRTDKVPYLAWGEMEHLTLTPGNRIDYETIKDDIHWFFNTFKVLKFGFDQWNFEYLFQRLVAEGIDKDIVLEYPQTIKMMSEPTKELEVLVAEARLIHNNNPILHWMAGNLSVKIDVNENIRPVKDLSSEKIDGMVATIMSLGMEMVDAEDQDSVYEERGMLEF